jgi:hypothetical protein
MTPTVSRLLFISTVTLALVCTPNAAYGKHHGGGSRGGFHSGRSHGGGRSHSGAGDRFHGGGGGHFSGKSLSRGRSAVPRQMGSASHRRSGGWASHPNSDSAYVGSRRAGSNGPRSMDGMAGRRLGTPVARAIAAGTRMPNMNFDSNRPPTAGSVSRTWSGQGESSWASAPRLTSSFNPNRPPTAGSVSRTWSGQGESSWASAPRSKFSFYPNRGLSNFRNSRFDNFASSRSSFSNSRAGSRVPRFEHSRFGAAHQFDWGATSFHRETSFGGDEFSFFPNLFGLALDLRGFGLRGLGMLGSGLAGFGVGGLDLLGSGFGGFSLDAGLESRQWEPGSTFYPTGNLTCPQ